MKRWLLKIYLISLGLFFSAYYIYHPGEDLTRPEVFWPDKKGNRPGPKTDMKPVGIFLDQRLASISNNKTIAQNTLSTWSSISGSSAQVNYLGTKKFSGDWTERLNYKDGINGVELVRSNWFFGPYLVALTVLHYNNTTSKLTEADIFFNGVDWNFGDYTSGNYSADFGNIFTHEMGHFLGLGHSQVNKATMSNNTHPQETKRRTLDADDRKGIRWLYPKTKADIPAPSLWRLKQADCSWSWTYDWSTEDVKQSDGISLFCLYGAGFRGSQFQIQLVSETTGEKFSPVSNIELLSENLIRFELDLTQLSPDLYGLELELGNGKLGKKVSALLVQ